MVDVAHLEIKADSSSVRTANTDLAKIDKTSQGLTRSLKLLLPAVTAILSAQAFKRMAREATEFGAAIGEVSTLLDDLTQLPRIEQEARNLSAAFGGTPTQQAKAFYQAISAGASNAAEATDILTAANRLAVGGVTDVETAVDGLTTIINSYGLSTSDATAVSDALFVAMRAGKTTIGEMSDSVGRVSALASSAGVSVDELLASVASLTAGGIKTTEAMSGLKAVFSNILKPTTDAEKAAEALGIEFNGAALEAQGLQGFMQTLIEKTGGSQEALVELFGSVEALNVVLSLTGGGAETFAATMEGMGEKAGQTEIAFSKMAEDMDFKLDQLAGKFSVARIEAGQFFLTVIEPFVDNMNQNFTMYGDIIRTFISDARDNFFLLADSAFAVWDSIARSGTESFGILDQAFGDYARQGLMSIKSFGVGFRTSLGIMEDDGLSTVEILIRAWSIGMVSILDATKRMGVAFGSTMDHIILWFKQGEMSAYEFATGIAQIEIATTGALGAITAETDRSFESLDNLKDKVIEGRKEFEDLSGTIGSANIETQGLNDSNEDLANTTGELVNSTGELDSNTRSAAEANQLLSGSVSGSNIQLEQQRVMIEGIQRAWADIIYDLLDNGKVRFKDFFDAILDGYKKMIAEMLAKDLMGAIFGGGGLGSIFNGNAVNAVKGIFTGNALSLGSSAINAGTQGAGLFAGAGLISGASQFMGGLFGTGVGAGSAIVGPPTAATAAGMNAAGLLRPAAIVAGAAIVGKLIHDATNDPDGRHRGMAGFLGSPTPGAPASSQFAVQQFASGFKPVGFADGPVTRGDADRIIEQFRFLDETIVDLVTQAGGRVATPGTLGGFGIEGTGVGTFFGMSDITTQQQFENQLDSFALQIGKHIEGLSPDAIARIMGANSAAELIDILAELADAVKKETEALNSPITLDSGVDDSITLDSGVDDSITLDSGVDDSIFTGPELPPPPTVDATNSLSGASTILNNLGNTSGIDPHSLSDEAIAIFGANSNESLSFAEANRRERVADNLLMVEYGYDFGTGTWDESKGGQDAWWHAKQGRYFGVGDATATSGPINLDGSHRNGLNRVPFDGYVAELHAGERVLNAQQAMSADRALELQGNNEQLTKLLAKTTLKFQRTLDKWDKNGLPAERV